MSRKRTYLFLQGLASPFFAELARALMARGHQVRRIHFSGGDHLFWNLPAHPYRGSLANWRKHLTEYLGREAVTDIILFGDCRPYHRVAISLAGRRRVQVHVLEEGYLRPHWITVERGGVNGHSVLPRDPAQLLEMAAGLEAPPITPILGGTFVRRAVWDVTYNAANVLGRPLYPFYRRHRPHHVFVEYAGWIRRLLRRGKVKRHADREVARAIGRPGSFFLVPLQLDSDYQIRVHSRFAAIGEFLDEVFASFAAHSPPEAELVVKVHPLDSGLIDRRRQVDELAARHGIRDRIRLIDGGDLPTLLINTRGVVVVNSTVGTTSLEVGKPTIALGSAIYNVPGLAFQGGLDKFWREGAPPDPALFTAFKNLVIQRTQVNGGFFSAADIKLAVGPAADRVEASESMISYPEVERAPAPSPILYPRPQPAE
jgi:capsular polysaccharide export protein